MKHYQSPALTNLGSLQRTTQQSNKVGTSTDKFNEIISPDLLIGSLTPVK